MMSEDHPGVYFPPPLIFLMGLAGGYGLHAVWPIRLGPPSLAPWIGIPLIILWAVFLLLTTRLFMRAKTNILPAKPASTLLISGPYRWTRNPIYLGFVMFYVGVTVWINSIWPLLLLPVVLFVMTRYVIGREERYLERRFGAAYLSYKARVRRWI
jgi:protein-S-isoprenylcysteine O-methyltransferase Ste14